MRKNPLSKTLLIPIFSILSLVHCEKKTAQTNPPPPAPGGPGSPSDSDIPAPRDLNAAVSPKSNGVTTVANPPRSWVWHGSGAMPTFDCNEKEDDIRLKSMAQSNVNVTSIYLGFTTGTNGLRGARLARFDEGNKIWCRQDLNSTSDTLGFGIVWNGTGSFYGLFATSGPQTDWSRYTALGWTKQPLQTQKRSVVVAKIDAQNGNVLNASYLYLVDANGQQQDTTVSGISLNASGVIVTANGATGIPLSPGLKPFTCSGNTPRDIVWTLDPELQRARAVSASGCTAP